MKALRPSLTKQQKFTASSTFELFGEEGNFPLFKIGSLCLARSSDVGQWHDACVVDLLWQARAYLVVFSVDGLQQVCTDENVRPQFRGAVELPQGPNTTVIVVHGEARCSVKLTIAIGSTSIEDVKRRCFEALRWPRPEHLHLVAELARGQLVLVTTQSEDLLLSCPLQSLTLRSFEAYCFFESSSSVEGNIAPMDVAARLPAWFGDILGSSLLGLENFKSNVPLEERALQLRFRIGRFGQRQNDRVQGTFLAVLQHQLLQHKIVVEDIHRLLKNWLRDHFADPCFGLFRFLCKVDDSLHPTDAALDIWVGDEPLILAALEVLQVCIVLIGSLPSKHDWFRCLYPSGKGPRDKLPVLCIGHHHDLSYWALEQSGLICFAQGEKSSMGILSIQYWDHRAPENGHQYFLGLSGSEWPSLAIGVAMYNEEPNELQRTLLSLSQQEADLSECYVTSQTVLVTDGHEQIDKSTLQYLEAVFCGTDPLFRAQWHRMLAQLDECVETSRLARAAEMRNDDSLPEFAPWRTFVVERIISAGDGVMHSMDLDVGVGTTRRASLKISLIMKADNRRKHNSGQWMMSPSGGFARALNCTFLLMTDCGTMFERNAVAQLVRYLKRNEMCVGCTARARVLWANEQDAGSSCLEGISMRSFFRLVQMADYEMIYALQVGCFSLAGLLPVLPGPCALFRYKNLISPGRVLNERSQLSRFLDHYSSGESGAVSNDFHSPYSHFENVVVHSGVSTSSLVRENVKIAEDRIPSYSAVTHGSAAMSLLSRGPYTTWVPGLGPCGPVFKVQAETEIRNFIAQRRRWINGALNSFIWLCFSNPLFLVGAPGVSVFRRLGIYFLFVLQIFNYIIAMLFTAVFASAIFLALVDGFGLDFVFGVVVASLYAASVLLFAIVHHFTQFVKPFFYVIAFINSVGMVSVIVALAMSFSDRFGEFYGVSALLNASWIVMLLPFVCTLFALEVRSFFLLLLCFIPYVLFLPTMVGTFTLYAMARLGDTSWGNRVTSESSLFSERVSAARIQSFQRNMESDSQVVLSCLVIINAGLLIMTFFFYKVELFLVLSAVVLFSPILLQVSLSILFFICQHLSWFVCRQQWCCKRRKRQKNDERLVPLGAH